MGAHGANKLLEDVQTYHDMQNKIVVQKMHQITPPAPEEDMRKDHAATHNAAIAKNRDTLPSGSAATSRRRQSSENRRQSLHRQQACRVREWTGKQTAARQEASRPECRRHQEASRPGRRRRRRLSRRRKTPSTTTLPTPFSSLLTWESGIRSQTVAKSLRRTPTDGDRKTSTACSRSNASRTRGICRTSQATSQGRRGTTQSSRPGKGFSRGRPSKGSEGFSKTCRSKRINRTSDVHSTRAASRPYPWGSRSRQRTG
jgi:hypothetical protein